MRAAIMQPTYLPWLGYFAMMDRVDVFVFLDSVQFARRSWQQRNRIKTANGELFLTIPVIKKGRLDQMINEALIDHSADFLGSHIKALTMAYGRLPYFKEYAPRIFDLLEKRPSRLCDLTISLILMIKDILGIKCRIELSSSMNAQGAKADLLADICELLGAEEYLSALGSQDYIEESDAFENRGIKVIYNHYDHPRYPQAFGDFLPFMSVVDLLFACGPESLSIIRSGITARSEK